MPACHMGRLTTRWSRRARVFLELQSTRAPRFNASVRQTEDDVLLQHSEGASQPSVR
jgi:hypothetical protein